jgi:hypothetical protein
MKGEEQPSATFDRVRCHWIALRMPRALEVFGHVVRQFERGEINALEAVDTLLSEEFTIHEGGASKRRCRWPGCRQSRHSPALISPSNRP